MARPRPPASRTYRVGVFHSAPASGTRVAWQAYLPGTYNPQWPGCCVHEVRASSPHRAKQAALAACKHHGEKTTTGHAYHEEQRHGD